MGSTSVVADTPRGPAGIRRIAWRAPAARRGEPPALRPLGYLPALDGIRALAVIAVFVFHAGFGWASGGFLGVSVFFTLSGYLITRLLLDEALARRSIDLLHFWARRLRRLLPAALVTVGLVLALAATVLRVSPDDMRGDVFATLGYVANWRFLFTGQSYQSLFTEPSPLLHFWSLAIEEQFYLLFPIVLAVVAAAGRASRIRARLRVVLLIGMGLSLVATALAVSAGDGDFVYYSTPTRAAELLAGALLACSLAGTRLAGTEPRRWTLPVGLGAVGAIALLCATTTRTTDWVTNGGLPVFSLLSVALIAAALPRGPFSAVLSIAPLRGLGKISYGVYLFHWPVILWLDQSKVGVSGVALAGFSGRQAPLAPAWDTAVPAPRVAMFGDSTAMVTGLGLATWGNQTGALRVVGKDAGLGCPIARGGEIKYMDRPPFDPFEKCGDWGVDWAGIVDQTRPDVAVIVDAPFDIADRLLPGDTQWRAIGDPVFDQYLKSELLAATDLFLARGIKVVWVNTPLMEAGHWDAVKSQYPENDPARVRRFNRMLGEIAAERPGVTMIDLRSWLRQTPGGENNWDLRPDGVHFTEGAAVMVAGWLGPAILNAVRPPPAV